MNKSHCDKHEEYHVKKTSLPSGGGSYPATYQHCKKCQRVLAESFAGMFGLTHRTKYINKDSWWAYSDSGFTFCYNLELVNKILSPDGAFKAWEHVRKLGWMHRSDNGNSLGFCREVDGYAGGKWDFTKEYDFDKYGPEIAIMLAALEAVERD